MAVSKFKAIWTLEKVQSMEHEHIKRLMSSESLHKLAQKAIQESLVSSTEITVRDGAIFAGAYAVLIGHEEMLDQDMPLMEHCVAFAKFARSLIEAFERDDIDTFQRDYHLLQTAYDLQKELTLQFGLFHLKEQDPPNRRSSN